VRPTEENYLPDELEEEVPNPSPSTGEERDKQYSTKRRKENTKKNGAEKKKSPSSWDFKEGE